jgi:hypothetical protein
VANIDDLLRKQNEKLSNKMGSGRKKVTRKGAMRPWQENLPKYQIEIKNEQITRSDSLILTSSMESVAPQIECVAESVAPQIECVAESVAPQIECVAESVAVKAECVAESVAVKAECVAPKIECVAESVAESVAVLKQMHTESSAVVAIVQLQRKLLFYIYDRCSQNGSFVTPLITKVELREALKTSTGALRQAIIKLDRKKLLIRFSIKKGVAGGIIFQLPERIFQSITLMRMHSECVAPKIECVAESVAESVAPPLSSSSISLDLKTTNYWKNDDREKITDLTKNSEWDEIDFDCLAEIGFNRSHVAQVASGRVLTPKSLQDSIYAFCFDLNVNQKVLKISGDKLPFFMGLLRRGPYSAPANYESLEDKQLREYLDAKEKLLIKRRDRIERLKVLEFEDWMDLLPPSEFARLAPLGTTEILKRSQLMNHFESHLWPEKKREILDGFRRQLGSREEGAGLVMSLENTEIDRDALPPLNPPLNAKSSGN